MQIIWIPNFIFHNIENRWPHNNTLIPKFICDRCANVVVTIFSRQPKQIQRLCCKTFTNCTKTFMHQSLGVPEVVAFGNRCRWQCENWEWTKRGLVGLVWKWNNNKWHSWGEAATSAANVTKNERKKSTNTDHVHSCLQCIRSSAKLNCVVSELFLCSARHKQQQTYKYIIYSVDTSHFFLFYCIFSATSLQFFSFFFSWFFDSLVRQRPIVLSALSGIRNCFRCVV